MTEQWIQGRMLQRITFRGGLVLNLEEYNELVISVPIDLTLPAVAGASAEVVRINPSAIRGEQKPLFDFAGAVCTHADWDQDGSLHLQFSGGQGIDVPSDDHQTAWELYGKYHGYAACLRRGQVRVVRYDLPAEEATSA